MKKQKKRKKRKKWKKWKKMMMNRKRRHCTDDTCLVTAIVAAVTEHRREGNHSPLKAVGLTASHRCGLNSEDSHLARLQAKIESLGQ
ncbi:hypothetical protein TcWFU_002348 [Taenia crassiceps]|uniref:Uncharacterized protein n=1 Tax=Taenia crassiceps TaxID=6207 RepID=A0ABR4Q1E3_9CEST